MSTSEAETQEGCCDPGVMRIRYGIRVSIFCITFAVLLIVLSYTVYPQISYVPSGVAESKDGLLLPMHLYQENYSDPYLTTQHLFTEKDIQNRNYVRLKHLRRSCNLMGFNSSTNYYMMSHMHVDEERKTLYCFVPKVACTSWKRIWMKLNGVVPPNKNLSDIDRYVVHTSLKTLADLSFKEKRESILNTYKKFMFVRHPFDRVLSAFKDKLESNDKQSGYDFHKEVGLKIQVKYRKENDLQNGHNVTFAEFMQFISEDVKGTTEQRNEHWLSIHEICNPCGINYDFIGNYETLAEDANYILNWMGATELIKEFPKSDRPFHAKRYDPKYLSLLKGKQLRAFFSKYIPDYLAFNYDFLDV